VSEVSIRIKKVVAAAVTFVSLAFVWSESYATTTVNGSLPVAMTVQAQCKLQSLSTTLQFGTVGVLDAPVAATAALGVQCTNTTPFSVGLSAGAGTGATVAARVMTNGSATVTYSVYRDSGHTMVWGVTSGTDVLASTGTGALQTFTFYGQAPAQATPAAGAYADTLAVTITY
jgi:spore coat protein U-like protein